MGCQLSHKTREMMWTQKFFLSQLVNLFVGILVVGIPQYLALNVFVISLNNPLCPILEFDGFLFKILEWKPLEVWLP